MQFNRKLASALASAIITGLSLARIVNAGAVVQLRDNELSTPEQILEWIATTDANLTFIGDPLPTMSELSKRGPANTMVVYCTTRSFSICGGACTVYNGNAKCLSAPNTNCLRATTNVAFCSSPGCTGDCNPLATCGVKLDNGFCFTPGTKSIAVPFT